MSRTLQFRRYNSATVANTIGANGELIINSTNQTITVHDGVTPGGYATLNSVTDNNIDQFARNTANTATNNITVIQGVNTTQNSSISILQGVNTTQNTNITSATNLAQAAYNNSNTKFSSSGGTVTGNVTISNNLSVTNNTFISNTVEANNAIFDGTLLTGLAARSSVVLPHLVAQFASNSSSYIQTNSQNINPAGSADYVVTADNGTDTDFYLDLGLHNSQSYDKVLTPYDGYLFMQGSTIGQAGGNLIIGTTSSYPGLETKFVAGGYANNNVVMKLGTYGANVIGNLTVGNNMTMQSSGSFGSIQGRANTSMVVYSGGSTGQLSLQWTNANPANNVPATAFSGVILNGGGGGTGDILIITGTYNPMIGNFDKVWTFGANGVLKFPNNTTQTGGAISITELKALVANAATYAAFQSAIAAL